MSPIEKCYTTHMQPHISCIIPAHNEGPRIGAVLDVVCGHPLVSEVIVINDGSIDDTADVLAKRTGITVISQYPNKGKTYAIMLGLQKSQHDLVMFIDADLVGLTREDITNLAAPVLSHTADMTLSLRENSLGVYKAAGIDFFSGERVFDKDILGDVSALAHLPKFGLETYMNNIVIKNKLKIHVVPWKGVAHARKTEKMGFWKGNYKEVRMVLDVAATLGIADFVSMIKSMRSLMVR